MFEGFISLFFLFLLFGAPISQRSCRVATEGYVYSQLLPFAHFCFFERMWDIRLHQYQTWTKKAAEPSFKQSTGTAAKINKVLQYELKDNFCLQTVYHILQA